MVKHGPEVTGEISPLKREPSKGSSHSSIGLLAVSSLLWYAEMVSMKAIALVFS